MLEWKKMLSVYYKTMGWEVQGRPLPETLQKLGLGELVPDMQKLEGDGK